jgi:hypothetical protein
MGKLEQGIFGPITGKIKNMVFYQLNGKTVVRSLGLKKNVVKSEALKQRNRSFSLLAAFLSKVKPFIKAGFKNEAAGTVRSYYNIATSYNLLNALNMVDSLPNIQFEKVMLSKGKCPQPLNPTVTLEREGLKFGWSTASLEWRTSQDRVMMLVFYPDLKEALFDIDGPKRAESFGFLHIPPPFKDERMEIYIAFIADDKESVSDSIYMGRIN